MVVYLCGPLLFMHGVRTALLEKCVPIHIHDELFGLYSWSPVAA